tara:strand:+ start:5775 stop:6383 length:609 start_codon:yes stop_codon:yes gene_type:complete
MQGFNVTREVASRLIGKSLRTIDRYLKSGKIRFIKVEGRTWLSREDVLSLAKRSDYITDTSVEKVMSANIDSHSSAKVLTNEIPNENSLELINSDLKLQLEKNKNLLGLALKKIKSLKLELSESINIKEHETKIDLFQENQKKYQSYIKKMDFHYKTKQRKYQSQISTLNHKLDSEKLNKMVIAFILGLILIVQPLILFLLK